MHLLLYSSDQRENPNFTATFSNGWRRSFGGEPKIFIILAKRRNIIREVRPILLELKLKGVRFSDEIIEEALTLAKEK